MSRWLRYLLLLLLLGAAIPVPRTIAQTEVPTATVLPTAPPLPPVPASDAPRATETPAPAQATAIPAPTDTASPPADVAPSACEPNDTPATPCGIVFDQDQGLFELSTDDDDYYTVAIPASLDGRVLVTLQIDDDGPGIRLAVLDPRDATVLRQTTSDAAGQAVVVIEPQERGWFVIGVLPQTPHQAALRYRLAVTAEADKSTEASPAPSQPATRPDGLPWPDAYENNYDEAHAVLLAPGVGLDLNFTCPDPTVGCRSGDHDWFLLPVKAGLRYLVATYDLGPGTDTAMELLAAGSSEPFAGNDDATPGASVLSLVQWTSATDGIVVLRVGPAAHTWPPRLIGQPNVGSYRLMAATLDSPAGQALLATVRTQAGIPTPTILPTSVPSSPVPPAAPLPTTGPQVVPPAAPMAIPTDPPVMDSPRGPAVLLADTPLYGGPSDQTPLISSLTRDQAVALQGRTTNGWVLIVPDGGVAPGWVPSRIVRLITAAAAPSSPPGAAPPDQQRAADTTPVPPPPQDWSVLPRTAVQEQPPLPTPLAQAQERVSVSQRVQVCRERRTPEAPCQPVPGVLVVMEQAMSGAAIAKQLTDPQGVAVVAGSLSVTERAALRIPAWGLRYVLEPSPSPLTIEIPPIAPEVIP